MTDASSNRAGRADGPSAGAVRALMFEADECSREVDVSSLERLPPRGDNQLLWVDVTVPDGPARTAASVGADPARLDPDEPGGFGLVADAEWKYLHVRALQWHDGQRPTDVPVAVGIGPNTVVTVHRVPVDFLAGVLDDEADHLRVGVLEATSFAASLLDRMLTDYLDARDAFESSLDRLELLILRRPRPTYLAELQSLRHRASRLRRYLAAQRDLFDALGRPDFDPGQSESAARHWHLLSARYGQVMASVEAARELVNGSFDLYTSRAAESTNQTMHTLTVVTVVMGLAATISGVFGMNFETSFFDKAEHGFVITTTIVIVLIAGAIGWALRRMVASGR